MPARWAIDLGTTNSVVAMEQDGNVRTVDLPGLGRTLPVDQSPLIPSAVHVYEESRGWWIFRRRFRRALAGQAALSRNYDGRSPAFAQSFKRYLATEPHRPMLRVADRYNLNAREVARLFLDEVLKAVRREYRVKPVDLTIPSPVGYYEHYRAELQALVRSMGIQHLRTLDEPVAAALGYGINVAREETLLVVDFGGGTLNLAAVRLGEQTAQTGKADVIAKHMISVGGDDVDRWLVEMLVRPELRDLPSWQRDILWEAMWVKERVSREGSGEFRWGGLNQTVTRLDLVKLLAQHGVYDQLRTALNDIQQQLTTNPDHPGATIDQVLLVGGSTQLPEVPGVVDDVFPQAVVRHDPLFVFTSVALGAARFAGGTPVEDFIYHDYALAVQNEHTHTVDYELLVPRRTRYPTPPGFAVRWYADYSGMKEVKLKVCEVGRLGQMPVDWQPRPNGPRYWTPRNEAERALVAELNPADSALLLQPEGRGTSPRLRAEFFIDPDRWLRVTVEDLISKQVLRDQEPVVRLR